MPNMVSKVVLNLGISVHTKNAPTDEEWAILMTLMKQCDLAKFRAISFTEGGAPTARQRKAMTDYLAGRVPLTAVVTSSSMARGVVTAMSWFNPNMKAFAPDHVDQALRHLQVSPSEFSVIKAEVRQLASAFKSENLLSVPLNL